MRLPDDWRPWLRESAVEVNDGVVSAAGVAEGFASAGAATSAVVFATLAVMVAGGISAAGTKYGEERLAAEMDRVRLEEERRAIEADPEGELAELVELYRAKGLRPELAEQVARELSDLDALAAHADAELRLDGQQPASGAVVAAAVAGASYAAGGLVPLGLMTVLGTSNRVSATFVTVLLGLALTGWLTSWVTRLPALPLVRRNVLVGALAMTLSLVVGSIVA